MVTATGTLAPPATVKCWPSILKLSAVTEMRYLPAGRSSEVVPLRSVWSPLATTSTAPGVVRVEGHWQAPAAAAPSLVPSPGLYGDCGARFPGTVPLLPYGRQASSAAAVLDSGSPTSSTLINHL